MIEIRRSLITALGAERWRYASAMKKPLRCWLTFHDWCKRVMRQSGREERYRALCRALFEHVEEDADVSEVWTHASSVSVLPTARSSVPVIDTESLTPSKL